MIMKAVIFDLWNTLVRAREHTFTQCIAHALDMNEDCILDYIRASSSRNSDIHYTEIVQEIWQFTHHASLPPRTLSAVHDVYKNFVRNAEYVEYAETCLRELREYGYRIGVVSNATSVSDAVVRHLKLDKAVDRVFLSCFTGFLKPDPRAFHQASREWGISPEQICVVGDKISTDILGAKLARMHVLWYAPLVKVSGSSIPVDIVGIISSLMEVPKLLGEMA
jgi:HAD superfamily hydrolase (TIGR01662 family)